MKQGSIETNTGATLNAYWVEPPSIRGIVQINHGLTEHAGRYHSFMEHLAAQGFAVIAHDHRGHGHTTAPDSAKGVFAKEAGARKVIEDTLFVQRWCTDRWPGVPLVSFGHSMGGLIALNAAVTAPDHLSGLAIWNSNAVLGMTGQIGKFVAGIERAVRSYDAPATVLPAISFGAWDRKFASEGEHFFWLSRNPDVVAAYEADPLCGFAASTSLWGDVLSMALTGEDPRLLKALPKRLPIQLVGGGRDPATDGGKAVEKLAERLRGAGAQRVSVTIYPEARHETLHEPEAAQAIAAFEDWLDGIVGSD